MQQLTIQITDDSKYQTFLDFIKTLDYVKVNEGNDSFLSDLFLSLEQVSKIKKGKLPKKSIESLLNELKN